MGGGDMGMRFRDSDLGQKLHQPKWDTYRLSKFEKFFYHEHPAVAARSPVGILSIWRCVMTNYKINLDEYE